ncbi:uncharacterized protein LOC143000639 [Genypterus blacodes]|uniref:uncharacterized protein LOC143000639 n=1 Tax=Genypterus blacodes TaxID=154954 RepID=UPI003F75D263
MWTQFLTQFNVSPGMDTSMLQYYMWLPVVLGALLVGFPYSISITVQWLLGWPSQPGYKKYLEALKPRRIYSLTKVVLGSLTYVQYGRLALQLKLWYKSDQNRKHFEKGITFGRRGNKLDLYRPPTAGSYIQVPTPLVVFLYGGAWGSGERSIYCLLARQMAAELGATVICPDYSTFPQGNVLAMVQDVADCLIWAQENAQEFNFDKDNIVLIGHSAGAHLCALTTLFLIDSREELFIKASRQRDIAQAIRGIIGLSGVYNIMDHYKYEQMRAVEYVSTMHKAMDGVENFPYYSPIHVVRKISQDKLKSAPPFALLHGMRDNVVPVESSKRFSELLSSLSVKVSLYLLPRANHIEVVTDLMASERHYYHPIYNWIKQEYNKFTTNV